MDIMDEAFENNAAEISLVSDALMASHERNQQRLKRLLRKHPDIVEEVEREFSHQEEAFSRVCGVQNEVFVRPRRNNRPQHHIRQRES